MMQQVKLEFSLLQYTPDRNIEVNLTWNPPVIKTHEKFSLYINSMIQKLIPILQK